MLQKAGWKEGSGLGATGSGIVQPIDRSVQGSVVIHTIYLAHVQCALLGEKKLV